jgi:transcriptional regulator with XRE-family HTH domain
MAAVIGLGRKQPDGKKVVELRKQLGLKQEVLADKVSISVRLLRDIETKNHPVPSTTITAIATELKVSPDQIIVPDQDQDDSEQYHALKLKPVRSASELANLCGEAHQYMWDVGVDPTSATAKEMQALLRTIRRLVVRSSTDEFDNENATGPGADAPDDFGLIARLARLQEALDTLRANGVGVLAASYYKNSITDRDKCHRWGPVPLPVPGTEQFWQCVGNLEIRFVPGNVDENEISVDTGIPFEQVKSLFETREMSEEQVKIMREMLEMRLKETRGTDHDEPKT